MSLDVKDLLRLKEEITTAKETVTRLEGKQEQLMHQLATEWGCKSLKAAEKKLAEMRKELEEIEASVQTGLEEISRVYEDID